MAYWDGHRIVDYPDKLHPDYPGWVERDCGCCAGIKWGGESPVECEHCGGGGFYWLHLKSGVIADYPGGPLRGREPVPMPSEQP